MGTDGPVGKGQNTMTVGELEAIVLEYAPRSGEVPGDMNGEVTGIATTFAATLGLREAVCRSTYCARRGSSWAPRG